MVDVIINDPVKWCRQCMWIYVNCDVYVDKTNWAMWTLGQEDIVFSIPERDAVVFTLLFS